MLINEEHFTDLMEELFQEIKHGDQEHQDWLENKIIEFTKKVIERDEKLV